MSWADALKQPTVLFEGVGSVVVANDGAYQGKKALQIWLAAGDMSEVSNLLLDAENYAKNNGFTALTYCGRRGWIRSHGFKEVAVVSVKEFT